MYRIMGYSAVLTLRKTSKVPMAYKERLAPKHKLNVIKESNIFGFANRKIIGAYENLHPGIENNFNYPISRIFGKRSSDEELFRDDGSADMDDQIFRNLNFLDGQIIFRNVQFSGELFPLRRRVHSGAASFFGLFRWFSARTASSYKTDDLKLLQWLIKRPFTWTHSGVNPTKLIIL